MPVPESLGEALIVLDIFEKLIAADEGTLWMTIPAPVRHSYIRTLSFWGLI